MVDKNNVNVRSRRQRQMCIRDRSSWTTHTTYDQSTYKQSSPVAVSLNLTGNLAASSIIFRLEQASHSGSSFDHWGVDDIVLNTVDNTACLLYTSPSPRDS